MPHGYLRDYDERYDRGDDRDRWRDGDRDFNRDWERGDDRNEGNRGFMFGDRGRRASGGERGGFADQAYWDRSARGFRSRQDDHYMSWRDKQMDALDRDYADYCRERERQFHSDFDT